MIALRTYVRDGIEGVRLVDELTFQFNDVDSAYVKNILKHNRNAIINMEITDGNKLRVINNNNSRVSYYKKDVYGGLQNRYYCYITGYKGGSIDFIADTSDRGIIIGKGAKIGEIAYQLGVDVKQLKFINGYIDENNSVYVSSNDGQFVKLSCIKRYNSNDIFSKDWKVDIDYATQNGLIINSISNKGTGKASIPSGVCYIDSFDGGVNDLTLPDTVQSLGDGCFAELEDLYTIRMGKGLRFIPESCFENSNIRAIKLSGSERIIGENAFASCYKLCGIIVTNATKICDRAFYETNISGINLLKCEYIEIESFAYNDNLVKVKLGENLKHIRGGAFRYCDKLEEVIIPPSTISVGKYAFADCKRLKSIKIPYNTKVHPNAVSGKTQIIYYK